MYLSLWEQENTNKLIKELYWYYYHHGIKSIIIEHLTKKILQPLICIILLLFTTLICFPEYLWYFYTIIIISIGLLIYSFIGIYNFTKIITKTNRLHKIYEYVLEINEDELQTEHFSYIVEKIINIHNNVLYKEPKLNELDIIRIITLKDNYILGMINSNIITPHKELFTSIIKDALYISLDYCGIFNNFDQSIQQNIIFSLEADEKLEIINKVRKRFRLIGLLMLLFMPIVIIIYLLTLIFTYAERIRNNPQLLSTRQWTYLSLYKFRDYNELPHEFTIRINKSYKYAKKYVNYFDIHWLCILSEFIIFLLSGIFFILVILTFTKDHTSYVLMLGIIGTFIALIRNSQPSENKVYNYKKTMQKIVSNIHYLPDNWINLAHTPLVYKEFTKLFSYQISNWFDELQGLLLCPYIFGINIANNSDKLVNFIQKNSIFCEKIGYVYTKSMFEKDDIINNSEDSRKLQMSIINFQQNYPKYNKLLDTTMDEHLSKTFGCFNKSQIFQQFDDDIESQHLENNLKDTFNEIVQDMEYMIEDTDKL